MVTASGGVRVARLDRLVCGGAASKIAAVVVGLIGSPPGGGRAPIHDGIVGLHSEARLPRGLSLEVAIRDRRLRPILPTTLTTFFGLT